ncbi:MAG TPA: protein kinase [Longimicrobiales bacterium]|nr:protein kinase [Longimicrobiales bacterium]
MLAGIRAALAERYVLEREIGRGSTATVYAARDIKHGRRVAMKVMAADVASALGTDRFLQEIRTTARLNHPHILPLFDSGEGAGFIFFTMPLVEGDSLRQRMDRDGAMPLPLVLPLINQIAGALAYAHSLGIVHRDIKPQNILVTRQGHAWVADFGLARALASATDQRLTATAIAVGSPLYMSPEQAAGESGVDARSDIYSLACVSFELLCGTPPYTADTVTGLLARHRMEAPPSVRERRGEVSAAVDAALRRAMAKDRAQRFASAQDFAAALEQALAAGAAPVGPPRPGLDQPPAARAPGASGTQSPPSPTVSDLVSGFLEWVRALFSRNGAEVADPGGASAGAVASRPSQLVGSSVPGPATAFIGREDELRELRELLCESQERLVTIMGPGGVGKTRLALEAAEQVRGTFPDGVAYVALSGLASADLLVPAIVEALGLQLSRGDDPLEDLMAYLQGRQLLLVLDNFEHIRDAVGLFAALLDRCRELRILVTSRERLNLQHERLLVLDGLDVGKGDDDGNAAILFVASARRLDRHFQLNDENRAEIRRICQLLCGIPLAIELAAAWVRTLSCAEIRAELERDLDVLSSQAPDVASRHHSLRATFDASWRLLSSAEQTALARLAVFRSAFDRRAAAQVAEADAVLLRQLVDKSLLSRTGERLHMLDVVRAYALERLAADPHVERRARERHLAFFSAALEAEQAGLKRADPATIQRVADVVDDVRAAWEYAVQTENARALLQSTDGLFHFYDIRGWAREGAEVFERGSAMLDDTAGEKDLPRVVRLAATRLVVRTGVFLHRLGELESAESLLRRGLADARDADEDGEVWFALHWLGAVRLGMGDYQEGERLQQEALAFAERSGDRHSIGWSMAYLGNVKWARGHFAEATQLFTRSLQLLEEERDLNGMWVCLNNLGVLAASRQRYEEAQRRFREALALQPELKNPRLDAQALHNLGAAARELGDFAHARQWLQEALDIARGTGYRSIEGMTLVGLAELAILEGDEAAALAAVHRTLSTAAAAHNDPLALEALLTVARLRLRQGDRRGAAELASGIGAHPGSDGDVRRRASELLSEIDGGKVEDGEPLDLASVIDQILAGSYRAPAAVRRRHRMDTQAAGEP